MKKNKECKYDLNKIHKREFSYSRKADDSDDIKFFISTEDIDRGGDVMVQSGMVLNEKSVPLLKQHDSYILLGKMDNFKREKREDGVKTTVGRAIFHEKSNGLTNDSKYYKELVEGDFINKVSIGYRILEWQWKEVDGTEVFTVTKWELLEVSLVVIPMNNDARRKKDIEDNDLQQMIDIAVQKALRKDNKTADPEPEIHTKEETKNILDDIISQY